MALIIDITISNAAIPDLQNRKRKPVPGVMAKKRVEHKMNKYQWVCAAIGKSFLPAAFELQGCTGERFLHHFEKRIK